MIGFVVYGIYVFVAISDARAQRARQEAERRAVAEHQRLSNASGNYDRLVATIESWIPQCRGILGIETQKGNAFQRDAASRARAKSLDLIQRADEQLSILYERELTLERYQANEELNRLHESCENCPKLNQGQGAAKCMALDDPKRVQAHLQFGRDG